MQLTNKKILYVFLTCLFIFLVFEIAVRIFWAAPQKTYEGNALIKNEVLGYSLNPGFEGKFAGKEYVSLKINSAGFRDDEHSYEKNHDTFRILALGDTIFFGTGVPYSDTIIERLKSQLALEKNNIELINLAVMGYEFNQEFDLYFLEGYKYNPDLVIIGVAMNDLNVADVEGFKRNFDRYGDRDVADTKIESYVKEVCHSCVFLYSLWYQRNMGFTNTGYLKYVYHLWENESYTDPLTEGLKQLNSHLKENNQRLMIVQFPYSIQMKNDLNYGNFPQTFLQSFAQSENITYLDLKPYLDNAKYSDYFSKDGRILNSEGHKITAEIIAKTLKERQLINIS